MRENFRQTTIETYDKSAHDLAEYFKGIGARTHDIDLGFELAGNPENARVLEIGCGDGRDAAEIVRRTPNYVGMDASQGMLEVARAKVIGAEFVQADAAEYEMPENLDLIFAFASLLHLRDAEVQDVLKRGHAALKPDGIFFLSLKYQRDYIEEIKDDRFGTRQFFFYSPERITKLAGASYENVFQDYQTIGQTKWFTIALKNKA